MEQPSRNPTYPLAAASSGPVLGLLIDCIDDSYQNELLVALGAAARERGASLLCFAGGTPGAAGARNRIYDLVGAELLDALIVCAGTLETGAGRAALVAFCDGFVGIPKVSIGVPLPGMPNVLVDNADGTRQIATHLIEAHGRQRLAFIGGPGSNDEAAARQLGYKQALRAAGLAWDPALCVGGDFFFESGRDAIRVLLDERAVSFDAVVAANDDMALGALHELQLRGVAVPGSVSVVGFDDGLAASSSNPPLTTLRQPIERQARAAVTLALGQLDGESASDSVQLTSELMRRRSCGCPLEHSAFAVEPPRHPRRGTDESPLLQKRAELARDVLEAGAPSLAARDAEQLVDAFIADLRGKPGHPFAAAWELAIQRSLAAGLDLRCFHSVTTVLRRGAVPSLVELGGMLTRAETMLHESRVLLAHAIQQQGSRERLAQQRGLHVLSDMAQSLITCEDRTQLLDCLVRAASALQLPSCFIALDGTSTNRVGPGRGALRELALVVPRAAVNAEIAAVEHVAPRNPRTLLGLDQPRAYVIEPLFYGSRWHGVLVLELGAVDGSVYEALRAQLSAGLEALIIGEEEARGAALHRSFLQRAATHSRTLERVFQHFVAAQSSGSGSTLPPAEGRAESQATLKSAIDALASLAAEWSSVVGREQDTVRAPAGPPPSARRNEPGATAR